MENDPEYRKRVVWKLLPSVENQKEREDAINDIVNAYPGYFDGNVDHTMVFDLNPDVLGSETIEDSETTEQEDSSFRFLKLILVTDDYPVNLGAIGILLLEDTERCKLISMFSDYYIHSLLSMRSMDMIETYDTVWRIPSTTTENVERLLPKLQHDQFFFIFALFSANAYNQKTDTQRALYSELATTVLNLAYSPDKLSEEDKHFFSFSLLLCASVSDRDIKAVGVAPEIYNMKPIPKYNLLWDMAHVLEERDLEEKYGVKGLHEAFFKFIDDFAVSHPSHCKFKINQDCTIAPLIRYLYAEKENLLTPQFKRDWPKQYFITPAASTGPEPGSTDPSNKRRRLGG